MKYSKITTTEKTALIIGLLMTILPLIIKRYQTISDGTYGFITGLGIGIEILIAYRVIRRKNTELR